MSAYRQASVLAQKYRTPLAAIGAGILAAFILGFWLWSAGSERRGLENMPAQERRALYAQTLRTTELLCANPPVERALAGRCESFAEFLSAFPECDERCRSLVKSLRPTPTK
jgi:hypothetical protein